INCLSWLTTFFSLRKKRSKRKTLQIDFLLVWDREKSYKIAVKDKKRSYLT
ncbi:hypothetical protein HMPREF1551_01315, partial [Capnocytophaga sp. oral taxon 863 str. F0517]